tara:strand:- start:3852 stop:4214 length:363 start_codon:yes stop_codon:yes gene_type:complete
VLVVLGACQTEELTVILIIVWEHVDVMDLTIQHHMVVDYILYGMVMDPVCLLVDVVVIMVSLDTVVGTVLVHIRAAIVVRARKELVEPINQNRRVDVVLFSVELVELAVRHQRIAMHNQL